MLWPRLYYGTVGQWARNPQSGGHGAARLVELQDTQTAMSLKGPAEQRRLQLEVQGAPQSDEEDKP